MKEKLEQIKNDAEQALADLTKSVHAQNRIIDTVDLALQELEGDEGFQIPKPTLEVGDGSLLVQFEPFSTVKTVDIPFYAEELHSKWQHSVNKFLESHGTPVDSTAGSYKIGIGKENPEQYTWHVRLKVGDDEGMETVLHPKKKESKVLTIVESSPERGDWYGYISGVLKIGRKWRVYFEDRSNDWQVMYIESEDLENWSDPRPIGTTKQIWFVQYQNQIYAYGEDDHHMCIWKSDDGINHFSNRVKAFRWKLDTAFTLYFHEKNGEPRMFGRVRGTGDRDEGGWGNDLPDVDRRGISYHKADRIDGNWESRILADPMDYFDYDEDLRPDFYQPSFRPDGSGEIVVYFRDKTNAISKPDGSKRITGPIYPVSAQYFYGMLSISSLEPAVDISPFVEKTLNYDGLIIPHPGQVYIHPEKIEHEGKVWRVITRRSDEHYRKNENDTSGIYLVREKE